MSRCGSVEMSQMEGKDGGFVKGYSILGNGYWVFQVSVFRVQGFVKLVLFVSLVELVGLNRTN